MCHLVPNYDGYQWVTCLTNDYIMRVSNREHSCSRSTSYYCWYQCMLELHDAERGAVTGYCQCTPSPGGDNHGVITTAPTTNKGTFITEEFAYVFTGFFIVMYNLL